MNWEKLFIAFVIACTILTLTNIGYGIATTVGTIYQQSEKQLLADGDMEKSGTTNWTAVNVTLSKETTDPVAGKRYLRVLRTGASAVARQGVLVSGRKYKITGWARGDGTNAPIIFVQAPTVAWTGTNSTSWQQIDAEFTAVGTLVDLYAGATVGNYTEYDDLFVTEYKGSMVEGEKQILADGDMEASGTASWTFFNTSGSKETTSPYAGKRNLKITRTGSSGCVYQSITAGKTYHVTGWARGDGTNAPTIPITAASCSISGNHWSGTASTAWQRIDFVATFSGTSFALYPGTTTGFSAEFDDIYLTEYKGAIEGQSEILFHESFVNQAGVEGDGGVVTGSPTINKGASGLDASNNIVFSNKTFSSVFDDGFSVRIKINIPTDLASYGRTFFYGLDANHLVIVAVHQTTGAAIIELRNGSGNNYYYAGQSISLDTNTELTLTWDPATTTFTSYKNGGNAVSDSTAGTQQLGSYPTNYNALYFGGLPNAFTNGGTYLFATMFNKTLTADEVAALYQYEQHGR